VRGRSFEKKAERGDAVLVHFTGRPVSDGRGIPSVFRSTRDI